MTGNTKTTPPGVVVAENGSGTDCLDITAKVRRLSSPEAPPDYRGRIASAIDRYYAALPKKKAAQGKF